MAEIRSAVSVNLSDTIRVTLTDYGMEIYLKHLEEIYTYGGVKPAEDWVKHADDANDHHLSIQLWEFMHVFGPYMCAGSFNSSNPQVIEENTIKFPVTWR